MKKGLSFVVLEFLVVMALVIFAVGSVDAQGFSKQNHDINQSVLLNGSINGSGIAITTGESWNFYQGYSIHILGVDVVQSRAMIRLLHDSDVVFEGWTQVEDSFIYSKPTSTKQISGSNNDTGKVNNSANNILSNNNITIFSITVDSVYGGDTRDLVMLYPIYQYLDAEYETPVLNSPPLQGGDASNKTPLNNNGKESPLAGMSIAVPIMIIVASCMKIRNR